MSSSLDTGFSVLRFPSDLRRGEVAVGAVAWDAGRKWYRVRVLAKHEKIDGVTPERRLLIQHTAKQLHRWAETRTVPFGENAEPWTGPFWQNVREALTAGVRLDTPKAMEPVTSPDEIDLLYEAVVKPRGARGPQRNRMERVLKDALGSDIARATKPRFPVRAFYDVHEHVTRGASGPHGVLLLEAVNLAASSARDDADALVSRLLRIYEGVRRDNVRTIIAYAASPGGLNGETDMKEWMARTITHQVFDVSREASALRDATREALASISGQSELA